MLLYAVSRTILDHPDLNANTVGGEAQTHGGIELDLPVLPGPDPLGDAAHPQ